MHVEDRRTEAKHRAPSSIQEKLNEWLQSPEGLQWTKSRQELL